VALPYRFKAGGSENMAPLATQHHHRSTTKQPQKSFKSRHASKGALKELSKGVSTFEIPNFRSLTILQGK
jgi:pre-rRNA-processing protein TSR1